jgi:hypothetical protein
VDDRVFLLSPAHTGGKRCRMLLDGRGEFELAERLRAGSAPLGDLMSFLSALYFRGKLAYAQRFTTRGVWVITPDRGLLPPETPITRGDLQRFADVPIDAAERRYTTPLRDSALALRAALPDAADVVLLGSIATSKYADVLLDTFGRTLLFPSAFVGRGDMSRGGLLLRAARSGVELEYLPLAGATRRGPRAAPIGRAREAARRSPAR